MVAQRKCGHSCVSLMGTVVVVCCSLLLLLMQHHCSCASCVFITLQLRYSVHPLYSLVYEFDLHVCGVGVAFCVCAVSARAVDNV
jgi:hypothetical protein